MKKRPDRSKIKEAWITQLKLQIQSDGRIKKRPTIKSEEKYLRVLMLENGETIHHAFFDSNFKEK